MMCVINVVIGWWRGIVAFVLFKLRGRCAKLLFLNYKIQLYTEILSM